MADRMLHLTTPCRLCRTGPLGLRRCGGCNAVWIICDECDALWTGAELADPPVLEDSERLPCPTCGDSLWSKSSRWATRDEVAGSEWLSAAIANDEITLAPEPADESDE